jgi:hypothetical protein
MLGLRAVSAAFRFTPIALLFVIAQIAPAVGTADEAAVLTAGRIRLRVTNRGYVGNPDPAVANEPAGQWPGASGVEYLRSIGLAVSAINPFATDPKAVRRTSFFREWGPATMEPEDRIYTTSEGTTNGARFINDDSDIDPIFGVPRIDEDFLDGRDNDGDGRVDEDYAALGNEMLSLTMRDDGPLATSDDPNEPHVPLGLECRQLAWTYSLPGYQDFVAIEYTITNRSGHMLDSLTVGWRVDLAAGPKALAGSGQNDRDLPRVPNGQFLWVVPPDDPRRQFSTSVPPDSSLCARLSLRINGFSLADASGNHCQTPGIPSFLLLGHTIDPIGIRGPRRVGFRAYRSFRAGTTGPAGEPGNDAERYKFMTSAENIDPITGFITASSGSQDGDYVTWCSVGPFDQVRAGESVQVTVAFAIAPGDFATESQYPSDYAAYQGGLMTDTQLFSRHPSLANALNIESAFEGSYELPRPGFEELVPDCHGCETSIRLPRGSTPTYIAAFCPDREPIPKLVTDNAYTWFDFDCDYCTGVWDEMTGQGYFHASWNTTRAPILPAAEPDPPVPMSLSLAPTTFNLRSMSHWVTAFLEPPAPYTAGEIDPGSVLLNGAVPVDPAAPVSIGDHDGNGVADLMLKFDRAALDLTLAAGEVVPVTVAGTIAGHCFDGATQMRVIHATVSAPAAGSMLTAGSATTVQWEVPAGTQATSVALLSSLDDGDTWTLEAENLPDLGSCLWTVPNFATAQGRVAVVLVQSQDETGYVVQGVLAASGQFSIQATTGVDPSATPEFALYELSPNPAHGSLRVRFGLADGRPATMEVLDVSGRRVLARDVGPLGPGRHQVEVLGGLRPGIYLVRLRQGRDMRVIRAAVLE